MLAMVEQGFGVTIVGAAATLQSTSGVNSLPISDEPEPFAFSAIWSPYNPTAALRNLLDLASEMSRSVRTD